MWMMMMISSMVEGIVIDGSTPVSLLMAWLSLPAVESVANAKLVRTAFVGGKGVGFIVIQNGCCKNRVCLSLIGHKKCFMTLVFFDDILEVSAKSRKKLKFVLIYGCRSEDFRLS